jgi:DNA-binding winged helix-turn-helix (wHTH) protein/tetratricopeptide (TPR) repeat protein
MLLRLGDCELDMAAREVRLAGAVRRIEPRAYALLACLAERGNRVVTKQELLSMVWPGRQVSDASVARAVMKARQAIGDTGEPALIRTIPRVGYRLVVEPQDTSGAHHAAPTAAAASAVPLRIALLPFENATGDAALEWLEFGLMSLVAHAIGHDARLSPVATQSLLAAVDGAKATGHGLADTVRRATGAQLVVRSRVSRDGTGYEVAFECVGTAQASRVSADTPAELAGPMANALEEILFPGAAADPPQPHAGDPLAVAAFARGLQALARQRFPQAANLLRMALELTPGSPSLQLELLRALSGVGDLDGVKPLARRLLARAERNADLLLCARVHTALSATHAFHLSFMPAAFHAELALRVMGDDGGLDEQALIHLLRAQVAAFREDRATMDRSLDRLHALCERSGNRLLLLSRLALLATAARARVDYELAAELSMQAARGAQELHVPRNMVTAAINCACDLAMLGRWAEAAAHAEEAFAAALLLDNPSSVAQISPGACWIYRLTGTPAASQHIVDAMPADESLPPLARLWTLAARGHHAAATGDHALAAQRFARSLQLLRESGNRVNEKDTLPWLVCSLVRTGELDQAEAELRNALPATHDKSQQLPHWLLHSRALLAHARGHGEAALEQLLRLADARAAPLWRAWAALDAAWLQAEAGRCAEALALLGRLPPAFASHPLAHAVAARARFGCGDLPAAQRLHQRYLESARHRSPQPYLASLGRVYAGSGSPPPAPCLPSQM